MAVVDSNYSDIPLSESTVLGMSINVNDQQFFKRLMDRQDEVTETYIKDNYDYQAKLICDTVKNLINEQSIKIFERFELLEDRIFIIEGKINEITRTVDNTKADVERLKKIDSPFFLFIRIAGSISASLGIVRWLHGPF